MAYYVKGLLDKAISEYTKALAIEPDFAEAHYNLALVYGAKGAVDKEISEYEKALAVNPHLSEARVNLSLAVKTAGARGKSAEMNHVHVEVARNIKNAVVRMHRIPLFR